MSTHTPRQIGIIGDVHAQADHLEAALLFFEQAGIAFRVCVGDVVDGPGDAQRCCQLLRQGQVPTVRGNHDRWFLENTMRDMPDVTPRQQLSATSLEWLRALPVTLDLETVAGRLLLCHGVGANDMKRLAPDDSDYDIQNNVELQALLRFDTFGFLIGGHTHRRMVRRFGNLTAINAGTILASQRPRIATLDLEQNFVQFHDFENGALIPNCRRVDFGAAS